MNPLIQNQNFAMYVSFSCFRVFAADKASPCKTRIFDFLFGFSWVFVFAFEFCRNISLIEELNKIQMTISTMWR
jgi:hypothetical protein